MNGTQQSAIRVRQSKLIAAIKGASASSRLPSTTPWSHEGQYMGETGVQIAGHRLLVVPGPFAAGFQSVQLDGAELAVSSEAVQLLDGSTVTRSSMSVVEVSTAEASFSLVNSDHFLNIHSAALHVLPAELDHVDGLLGQTADADFHVEKSAAFTEHVEGDFLLPAGEGDLWSSDFQHNRYEQTASAQ